MIYLSQTINKLLCNKDTSFGKVVDLAVTEVNQSPVITKLVIKKSHKKFMVSAEHVHFNDNKWELSQPQITQLPYAEKELFLVEDLLDKQVIDINGRRLVRVNDISLKENGRLVVDGIDISFAGILRRLGISKLFIGRAITLPWSVVEAFDYQTGTVRIKLTQNKLNTFHPAEIADILEEAGTKERLGIVSTLDAQKAASAIEEANEETQSAILEQVPHPLLNTIVNRMHVSEIADVIDELNPFTSKQILTQLGTDKAKKIQRLLRYEDDEAGGLMDVSFYQETQSKTIAEVLASFTTKRIRPEAVVVVDNDNKYLGTVNTREMLVMDPSKELGAVLTHTIAADQDALFSEILRQFAEYDLRALPVIDSQKKVLGVIKVDTVFRHMQEEEEREDAL